MKSTRHSKALVNSPEALTLLRQGFEKLATPLASTLGPSQRIIMHALSNSEFEFLADTETIARRFIELREIGENVGAMMLRAMVLKLHEQYGDGAATATVLARDMLRNGIRLIAAGANPSLLKHGIERGIAAAKQEMARQVLPISGEEMFTQLTSSMTGDPQLGTILGEMLDILGENAAIVVNETDVPGISREYVSGGRWTAIPGDRLLIPDGQAGLELHHPLIMIVEENMNSVEQVQRGLELAASLPEKPPLLIVARDVTEGARDALVLNHVRGTLSVGIAILKTGITTMAEDMGDIAVLTGGQMLSEETGFSPKTMQFAHFGRARRATISQSALTIVDGDGNQQAIRKRAAETRAQMKLLKEKNEDWDRMRTRIGRLSGGIGILKVGAHTEHERTIKKEMITKLLRALDDIHQAGVVPGGGIAYLNCIQAVEAEQHACTNSDEAAGVSLVLSALEAPFCQIIQNAGEIYPPLALDKVRRMGKDYGFDARAGTYTSMIECGILDSAQIAQAVLTAAGSLAAMAITTDTLILM